MYIEPDKTNSQLVAHCFFCKGEVVLEDYSNYYKEKFGLIQK